MTNKNTSHGHKSLMDIGPSFITNTQSPKLMQPTQGAFHHPAVGPQPTAVTRTSLGNTGFNPYLSQRLTIRFGIVSPIGIQLCKTITGSTAFAGHRRYGIDQRQQLDHIMAIGCGGLCDNGNAVSIGQKMMFGTGLTTVYRARTSFFAPPTARSVALSTAQRLKSIWSAWRKWFSKTRWILSQTPAFCQSRKRRQQVMPEPQPISWGNISQGMPESRTNIMPVKQLRAGKGLRPEWQFLRGLLGMNGSIKFHKSSVNNTLAMRMPPCIKVYIQGMQSLCHFVRCSKEVLP